VTMDKIDREIIKYVQGDIPLVPRPFLALAQKLGLTEDEVVTRIRRLKEDGFIRRFAAILAHYQAGFTTNAMVAWKVDPEDADRAGMAVAEYNQVSHCYLRDVPEEFGYSFFTMIHASNEKKLERLVEEIAWKTGIKDYVIIRSIRELRKISMEYDL
jgi:DNA-binding Lrp family transcriptional regulator